MERAQEKIKKEIKNQVVNAIISMGEDAKLLSFFAANRFADARAIRKREGDSR